MTELTRDEVERLAATVGLTLTADDLTEVTYRLNGFLEALAPLGALPLHEVEPVPVLPDEVEFP